MKFIVFFCIITSISINYLYSKSMDRELEEKKIGRLVEHFVDVCKKSNFNEARKLTTGKEKKIFSSILKDIKIRNGMITKEMKYYFQRLRGVKVNVVEIDKSGKKAVAICTLEFRYFDSKSRDEIRKDREVYYLLLRIKGKWKISKSKLYREHSYYRTKTHRKWRKR
ncbi:MAG: hypothetical protein IEMM0008_0245 [bacterium]|nr:MAG: hypothetical protein IEMM0008_0245 [bacterium]